MKNNLKASIGVAVIALAVAAVPFGTASAATQSANSTVNVTVDSTITVGVSGDVNINVVPTASGATGTGSHTVTVGTNASAGYKLSLASSVADTTLANGSNTITAASGTFGAPAALGADTWGYQLPTFGGSYAGVTANTAPVTIKTTAAPAAADATVVTYGANVTTAKPSGTYSRVVTYTGITN